MTFDIPRWSLLVLLYWVPFFFIPDLSGQSAINHWSAKQRQLRYQPEGTDFVIVNGERRFNRALYGTNTAFRIECGDKPEFAFYLPGFGGNLRIGVIRGKQLKWLNQASRIEARYRAGSMIYTITDSLMGDAVVTLSVLALSDKEGAIIKVVSSKPVKDLQLAWAFGGGTGKKFRRDGDLNTDPESVFDLKPENCESSVFAIHRNTFSVQFGAGKVISEEERYANPSDLPQTSTGGSVKAKKLIRGVLPQGSKMYQAEAGQVISSQLPVECKDCRFPVLTGYINNFTHTAQYIAVWVPESLESSHAVSYSLLPKWYKNAEESRLQLANRIQVVTPDPFINTLGGTLAIAADAIWEDPTYLHGAIGWRMRLNGWRGPYTADPLGWHDRARAHYASYAESQVLTPASGPSVPDPKANLARQEEKMGNALYTSGYICREPNGKMKPHHYDMNLVFIDGLMRHFRWTGDVDFMKQMWPVIERHLAWEKRNFDADNDGLYDAYCCIWASDALEYSGGAVTHSTAYNYFANKMAADIALILGKDPKPYASESSKILNAMHSELWLSNQGWFAEFKDWSGAKRTHDAAALWTIYHALDSEVADWTQRYLATRYVDEYIPRLPVVANGLLDEGYYVHSTTNWQPYDWSINNVVMAENLHMALGYWQAGRPQEAFKLWKSTLLDAMYLGASPGNFVQLSFLDAARGEMYRDFADEVGMTARSLVEGLFGVHPDAIQQQLLIQPGFPSQWDHASLKTPDVSLSFNRTGSIDLYSIQSSFSAPMKILLKVPARMDAIDGIRVNGVLCDWSSDSLAVGIPMVNIECGREKNYQVEIKWKGKVPEHHSTDYYPANSGVVQIMFKDARVSGILDPQKIFTKIRRFHNSVEGILSSGEGLGSLFVQLQQGQMKWWEPVSIMRGEQVKIVAPLEQRKDEICFVVKNRSHRALMGRLFINEHDDVRDRIEILPQSISDTIRVKSRALVPGTNRVRLDFGDLIISGEVFNWDVQMPCDAHRFEMIDLDSLFNDVVTQIFKNEYLSPRWPYPTLQIPKHGVGNWCYHSIYPIVEDRGLRLKATGKNQIEIPEGIPFKTPSDSVRRNICFTSGWDNYPDSCSVRLEGKASHLYLLMAGSTNPMQSQIVNGTIVVRYTDGTTDELELINPENWWPIEQDYFHDGFAFTRNTPVPPRVHLKTGLVTREYKDYSSIAGYSNRIIDGGAATVVDMPLHFNKELESMSVKTLSGEVVIGLMSATLLRE